MSPHLPELLDPWRWAELGKRVSGRMAMARFTRLAGLIAGGAPEVEVELGLAIDVHGRAIVSGRARAELSLQCQRCLRRMSYPVDVRFRLAVVGSASEAERLPDDIDPLLLGEGRLSTLDLIEDELILSLPLVPRHPPEQCAVQQGRPSGPSDPEAVGPFEVLGALRQQRD